MTISKRDMIARWFTVIWEDRNLAELDSFLAPSVQEDDMLIGQLAPRRDIPLLVEVFHTLLGAIKIDMHQFMTDGDLACVSYTVCAAGADRVTPVAVDGMMMVRFEEGLIAEIISSLDCLSMFEQLGQMPPDTLAACFSGQSLTWK
ncbi:nuclear transport factor 2 family protein [Pseudophaeobacter flagellatus]|uniref:nuclear transport factor 2 family protein n=1 Tax=Pseudophaeobacter flagellatus TaxID=2899119 RepID=UPI001E5A3FB3|nr:nuclear transport factor 2 family protein [Pseudophaeobacter flagellatus]MCD9146738.1 nuclear transport factor 2 family protein [Pseudophaeobacter flagellatus]